MLGSAELLKLQLCCKYFPKDFVRTAIAYIMSADRLFSGPYFFVLTQNHRFRPYMGEWELEKTRILACFTQ